MPSQPTDTRKLASHMMLLISICFNKILIYQFKSGTIKSAAVNLVLAGT